MHVCVYSVFVLSCVDSGLEEEEEEEEEEEREEEEGRRTRKVLPGNLCHCGTFLQIAYISRMK
jgi:hypothetical protein